MLKILALMVGLTVPIFSTIVSAHEYQAGTIKIVHPWMREPPAAAQVAGGFMTLINTGTMPDRLIGGSLVTAARFEIHEMSVTDGVMRMKQLPQGIEIKPGATVALVPGGYHLMFFDLKTAPAAQQKIKGTLVFEKAGTVEVEFVVQAPATRSSGHGDGQAGRSGSGTGSGSATGADAHVNH